MLWVSALIGLMVVGAAVTRTVTTEAEAAAILGQAADLKADKCEVLSIQKTIESSDIAVGFERNWQVTYAMWYYRDGTKTRTTGTVETAQNTEAAVKAVVAPACEQAWAKEQAENATVDTVIIQPTAEQNSVLVQFYDYVKRQWKSTVQQAEP